MTRIINIPLAAMREHAMPPLINLPHSKEEIMMKKPSMRKAYNEMNDVASEVFLVEYEVAVEEMTEGDDYLYCLDIPADVDEETLMLAANELFHRIGVLDEDRDIELDEELDYCGVHRNEYSGKYFVLFNHPIVMERDDCGQTVKEFGEEQRARIAEGDDEEDTTDDYDEMLEGVKAATQVLAKEIKAGKIRSKSGEGYFVLAGEFYDAIATGKKKVEYRDITPRNLAKSIGIKTVKFQRGYGHPGQPPAQMRCEVKSVALVDVDDCECDPYNVPPNFAAMTIAIHLGKRLG